MIFKSIAYKLRKGVKAVIWGLALFALSVIKFNEHQFTSPEGAALRRLCSPIC